MIKQDISQADYNALEVKDPNTLYCITDRKDRTLTKLLTYGMIKELDFGITLWYEPITDVIDGFVLREWDGSIIRLYT